ncbi:MAG TPA: pyrroline-5-carboxylate reductase [Arsenicitalea sp.]|nr:pyrroline-5-carboxylate reductase [Arsenicitalea sp.]
MSLVGIGPVVLIGAGKMGMALARGWVAAGLAPADLVLVDPNPAEATVDFAESLGIRLEPSPVGVLTQVMVMAVKPQVMSGVLAEAKAAVGRQTLVISIAAGISIQTIAQGLGTERVIRTMPNTPAQIGKGITGAVVGFEVSDADRQIADELMRAAGPVVWFDNEPMLDAVTAVSGSGPAYVFYLVEALAAAGERQGFSAEQAMLLARQTIIGAAALLESEGLPASTLRENVTSPHGTTAAALQVLMADDGLVRLMDKAVAAARARSEELGRG